MLPLLYTFSRLNETTLNSHGFTTTWINGNVAFQALKTALVKEQNFLLAQNNEIYWSKEEYLQKVPSSVTILSCPLKQRWFVIFPSVSLIQRQLLIMSGVNLMYFRDFGFMAFCYPLLLIRCGFCLNTGLFHHNPLSHPAWWCELMVL